MIMKKET